MRCIALLILLALTLSACTARPDANHQLVAKVGHGGVYYLTSRPARQYSEVPRAQMSLDRLPHKSASPAEIEGYVRSQIKQIGSEARIELHANGTEQLVELNGDYFVMVSVEFLVPQGPGHGVCSQPLAVVLSLTGVPIEVHAGNGDLQTCLA